MSWQDLRPLVITDATIAEAAKVKAYAIQHRETMKELANRISTNAPGPGNDPQHVLLVPEGYRVVYSIEQQPSGWCQHFSISVNRRGMSPSPDAVSLILEKCFGIRWNMRGKPTVDRPDLALSVWDEPSMPGVPNILFPFKFPTTGL
jgi:hypothetical protein